MVPAPGTLIGLATCCTVGRPEDLHNAQLVIGGEWRPRCTRGTDLKVDAQLVIGEVATSLSTRGTDLKVERVVVTNEKCWGRKYAICTSNSAMT